MTTFLAYLHTLGDTYFLLQLQILVGKSIQSSANNAADSFSLDTPATNNSKSYFVITTKTTLSYKINSKYTGITVTTTTSQEI
jgi:hypothetical protein